ncbi:hypothetical protein [Jeotgalibacillus campisalis]|uniref:Uncharacterized protein n=1 Tax=Jeotgalibacillus campisalis TaxID=220754 RepID=A0A0C2VPL7_9BACL|nr:hypothetical protein [Jeotgalibacillus campisalis]KIL50857.1 hypothetical protein KR50_07380 [Jeotgalibacillus campisalis]
MHVSFWLSIYFILVGFVVLIFIKWLAEKKNKTTTQFMVGWIMAIAVWGSVSVLLVPFFIFQ